MLPGDEGLQYLRLPSGGEKRSEGLDHLPSEILGTGADVVVGAGDGHGQVLPPAGAGGAGPVEDPLRRRPQGGGQAEVGHAAGRSGRAH